MNEKDVRLMNSIMSGLGDTTQGGAVLLDVKSTQFVRVSLVLLRGLSEELQMPGIFISVDRPYQYMVHLLRMHQINPAKLTFIDVISRFSGDRKEGNANVGFVDGPFHVNSLPEALRQWSATIDNGVVNLKNCRFVLIDNLTSLLTYNNYSHVELFLRDFVEMLKSNANVLAPLMIDQERSPLLYETAKSLCTKEIVMKEEMRQVPTAASGKPYLKVADFRYVQGGIQG